MLPASGHSLLFGLSAFAALLPATLHALFLAPAAADGRGRSFWPLWAVAVAGVLAWTAAQFVAGWRSGFAPTLWLIVLVTLALFGGLAAVAPPARRLAAVLLPYLSALAALALLWGDTAADPAPPPAFDAWTAVHVVAAVLAFGLATLAAVAGLGVLLKERALKRKTRPVAAFGAALPAVADGEALQSRLLTATVAVLAVGLASGMAQQYLTTGALLPLTHKVLLAFVGFLLALAVLALHTRIGIGSRRLARALLAAYLVLALAYPGVKFVTDVLLAG